MLKGIPPLLTPELLKIMAEMGHDDALVLADANFTAMSLGVGKPIVRLPGVGLTACIKAITSLFPLAADVASPAAYMRVSNQADDYCSALQREVKQILQPLLLPQQSIEGVERYAFYERSKKAYAFIVTGELQPYGNFILRKGVLAEALRP